jgi:hypothetical protein
MHVALISGHAEINRTTGEVAAYYLNQNSIKPPVPLGQSRGSLMASPERSEGRLGHAAPKRFPKPQPLPPSLEEMGDFCFS